MIIPQNSSYVKGNMRFFVKDFRLLLTLWGFSGKIYTDILFFIAIGESHDS